MKNNPYDLLQAEEINKSALSDDAKKSLVIFDKTKAIADRNPKSKELNASLEKAGKLCIELLKKEIPKIKSQWVNKAEEAKKQELRASKSREIVKKSEVVLDELALCRKKLREDRQQKLESGEIRAPKKKTVVNKLKDELLKFARFIPEKMKTNATVLKQTQVATESYLSKLKQIWGLNKIEPIAEALKEQFIKLQEKAE